MVKHIYGCIPTSTAKKRLYHVFRAAPGLALPENLDMRNLQPPVVDQGQLGSCTGNGIAEELEAQALAQNEPLLMRSRLFIYYNERVIEGTVSSDAGASIPDGITAVQQQGACSEMDWPYDISRFAEQPPANCYSAALMFKSLGVQNINQDMEALKTALVYGGSMPDQFAPRGLVIGISVYDSFESDQVASSGDVPIPGLNENLLGGHCVRLVGYTDNGLADVPAQSFIGMNSWGTDWGKSGFFSIPYAYITNPNLCSDLWLISQVS
jgi:C1A family cysteine protease